MNAVDATVPEQTDLAPPERTIGGPPPAHLAGAGPTETAGTQEPPEQPLPAGQTVPHPPQFELSLRRLTHVPAQAVRGDGQLVVQPLERQTWPLVHVVPHIPQFFGSTVVSVQTPPHSVSWVGHAQLPAAQYSPPVQITPHPPQFDESV